MSIVAARSASQSIASLGFLGAVDATRAVAFIGGTVLLFWQHDLAAVDWLFGLGIAASILLWLRGRPAFDLRWPQPLLAVFVGVTAIATAVAGGSLRYLVITIYLILMSLAFTSLLRGSERRQRATESALMIAAALTVFTIALGVIARPLGWDFLSPLNNDYLRTRGLFKDPNVAGGFVAMVYPLAAAWAIRRPRHSMRSLLIVTGIFAFGVIFTFSRLALGIFAIGYLGLVVALWVFHERRLLGALVTATAASILLIVAVVGVDKIPLYRYQPIQGYDEGGRLVVWGFALQMFREAPLGTGAGSFEGRAIAMFTSTIDPASALPPAAASAPGTATVPLPGFHSRWVTQSAYPRLEAGEFSRPIIITLRNVGTKTWTKGTGDQAALEVSAGGLLVGDPSQPVAGLPGLTDLSRTRMGIGWPKTGRVAIQDEETVPPGAVGRFIFQLRAPQTAGTYVLPLQPVVEGAGAMENDGILVPITVFSVPRERAGPLADPGTTQGPRPSAPSGYGLPTDAVRVADSATLRSALEGGIPRDIVLADGVYDNSGPFNNATGHRLYAATLGGAVLRAGVSMGGNSGGGNGLLRGLAFDVSDPAKTLQNSAVHIWGSGAGTRILDTTFVGNGIVGSAVVARQVEGVVVERVRVRDFTEFGIVADPNSPAVPKIAPVLLDLDIAGIARRAQATSGARTEACLWLGSTVTVRRAQLRSCAWAGVWTGGASVDSSLERVDIDDARFGLFLDVGTKGVTFRDARLGSNVVSGIQATPTAMTAADPTRTSGSVSPAAAETPLTVTPSAHSFYLRAAVESGAIGLAALLAYLGILLATAVKRSSRASWQWPLAFALVLIAGAAIDTVHWRGLWIYAAMISATLGPQPEVRGRFAWPGRGHPKVDPNPLIEVGGATDRAAEPDPSRASVAHTAVATNDPAVVRVRKLIDLRSAALGSSHPDVAAVTHELAAVHHERGEHDQAESLYLEAIRIYESSFPADSPTLVPPLEDLAGLRCDQGREGEAEAIFRRALGILAGTRPPDDPLLARKRVEYRLEE